ncbi:MAG: hypothetical protein SH807_06715 [Blastochloris sp.]|nr:hypothetical protein [Blastochloris sp.]
MFLRVVICKLDRVGHDRRNFFPWADYWWFYLGFVGFILAMLALDLGVFHREAHVVTFKKIGNLERHLGNLSSTL